MGDGIGDTGCCCSHAAHQQLLSRIFHSALFARATCLYFKIYLFVQPPQPAQSQKLWSSLALDLRGLHTHDGDPLVE